MQSWLGACVIAGCAIGATGIVIHHYAKQPCPEQEVTYMISYDDWGRGIIHEFNRAIEKTAYKSPEWEIANWTQNTLNNLDENKKKEFRNGCVDSFAKLYGEEYKNQEIEKNQTKLVIDNNELLNSVFKCLILKPSQVATV